VGVDWNGLVTKWDELSRQNLRLVDLTTFHDGGKQLYGAVFREGNDGYALYEAPWEGFTGNWKTASANGLRLEDVAAYAPAA
jgi:hypothetical protein